MARDKPFCPYGRDCFYKHELADGTPYVFTEGVDTLMERWKRRRQTEAVRRQPSNERNFALAIRSIADSLFEIAAGVSGAQMPQIRAAQARALARLAGAVSVVLGLATDDRLSCVAAAGRRGRRRGRAPAAGEHLGRRERRRHVGGYQ